MSGATRFQPLCSLSDKNLSGLWWSIRQAQSSQRRNAQSRPGGAWAFHCNTAGYQAKREGYYSSPLDLGEQWGKYLYTVRQPTSTTLDKQMVISKGNRMTVWFIKQICFYQFDYRFNIYWSCSRCIKVDDITSAAHLENNLATKWVLWRAPWYSHIWLHSPRCKTEQSIVARSFQYSSGQMPTQNYWFKTVADYILKMLFSTNYIGEIVTMHHNVHHLNPNVLLRIPHDIITLIFSRQLLFKFQSPHIWRG